MVYLICIGIILPFIIILAACNDLVSFKIYNWINLLLIAAFAVASILAGYTLDHYLSALLAFAVVLAIGMVIFALRFMGGGDVKFAAAVALWFGWSPELGAFFINSMIIGGLFTLILLEFRAFPLPLSLTRYRWIQDLHAPKGDIPYGVALSWGALSVLPETHWFKPFLQ